jgi:hypothetical protein
VLLERGALGGALVQVGAPLGCGDLVPLPATTAGDVAWLRVLDLDPLVEGDVAVPDPSGVAAAVGLT